MKKAIIGILTVIFLGLLFMNFGFENKNMIANDTSYNQENDTETSNVENTETETVSTNEEEYILSDEELNETYETLKSQNEPLVVSVLLPSYYSDDFLKGLEAKFNTDTISFERVDIDGNTLNLGTIPYLDNTDAVIISALQIQDYNDEVLPEHNLRNVLDYYMAFYNNGITAIVLSEPNAHEHNNLENVLLTDQDYMANNDYYFVSNVDVKAENMFRDDEKTLSEQVESQIQDNIKKFLVK